jgi:hypothetical protein
MPNKQFFFVSLLLESVSRTRVDAVRFFAAAANKVVRRQFGNGNDAVVPGVIKVTAPQLTRLTCTRGADVEIDEQPVVSPGLRRRIHASTVELLGDCLHLAEAPVVYSQIPERSLICANINTGPSLQQ